MRPRLALRAARSESSSSRERYTARLSLSSIAFCEVLERLDRTVGRSASRSRRRARASGRSGPPASRRRTRARRGSIALLLEVGLAEVAAHERLAGVEAHRGLDLAAALRQVRRRGCWARPRPEPRERVRRVELDRLAERRRGLAVLHLRQVREAEDGLRPRQVRLELGRLARRLERRAAFAQGRADLREARPGERVRRARARPPSRGSRARLRGRTSPAARRTARPAPWPTSGRRRPPSGPWRGRRPDGCVATLMIVFRARASASLGFAFRASSRSLPASSTLPAASLAEARWVRLSGAAGAPGFA